MITVDEIKKSVNSVGINAVISKKEAKVVSSIIADDEKPMLLFAGLDERDNNSKKIILTDRNLFFLTSKAFRAVRYETVPLFSVLDIQEKQGFMLAEIAIHLANATIHINMVSKKASSKLVSFLPTLREKISSNEISLDKTRKLDALFSLKEKGAITEEEYEREKDKILSNSSSSNSVISQPTAPERKKSGCVVRLLQLAAVVFAVIAIGNIINNFNIGDNKTQVTNNFIPQYTVIDEENLTLAGVPRFEQRISIPLGLSLEELKQNLLDAAWKLQKKKNASAIVIFAFREDDIKREGGYTAGKCTLAPFGVWAKAMENHSFSDLKEEILISEAYSYNEPIRAKGSIAYVKENETSLYKPSKGNTYDHDKVLATLNKGTEVKILDCERFFGFAFVVDTYKVQVRLSKKKTLTGWIYGYKLADKKNE